MTGGDLSSWVEPPLHRALGIKLRLGEEGRGVAWIEVDPDLHYGNRWAHGGVLGVLVDVASGVAIARHLPNPLTGIDGTVELKVNFLRKVYDGDLTASATVVHLGRRIAVTDVDVTNKGVLCAKAIATFMLRRDAPPEAAPPETP